MQPPKGIEALPDRFVEMIVKEDVPLPDAKEAESKEGDQKGKDEEKVAKKEEKPKPRPRVQPRNIKPKDTRPPTAEELARRKAERERRRRETVANNTIIKFLGTTGGEGPGEFVDTLKDGASDVRMADAFAGTGGVVVATRDNAYRDRRRGRLRGTGKVAGIDSDELHAPPAGRGP